MMILNFVKNLASFGRQKTHLYIFFLSRDKLIKGGERVCNILGSTSILGVVQTAASLRMNFICKP